MPKVGLDAATLDTMLGDIVGIGQATFTSLGIAGYPIRRRTTLGEFQKMTGSYDDVAKTFESKGMRAPFVMTKIQSLWSGPQPGGTVRNTPEGERKLTPEEVDKQTATSGNFLLAPDKIEGVMPNGMDAKEKDIPEVDALSKMPDPTKAVPMGMLVGQPMLAVVPDVTLNVSQDARAIAAPMEVLPDDPVPVIPGIAVGPSVAQVRMTMPQTLEEKLAMIASEPDTAPFKADGEKDIMGDGSGAMTEDARIGPNEPGPPGAPPKGVAWLQSRMRGTKRKAAGGGGGTEDQKTNGHMENEMVTGTRHPFKQPSLFRNHDARLRVSKELMMAAASEMNQLQAERASNGIQLGDPSFYRSNPATQGVRAPFVPPEASNYLERGPMVTAFQTLGPNPLVNQWPPSPAEWELQSGPFR